MVKAVFDHAAVIIFNDFTFIQAKYAICRFPTRMVTTLRIRSQKLRKAISPIIATLSLTVIAAAAMFVTRAIIDFRED